MAVKEVYKDSGPSVRYVYGEGGGRHGISFYGATLYPNDTWSYLVLSHRLRPAKANKGLWLRSGLQPDRWMGHGGKG